MAKSTSHILAAFFFATLLAYLIGLSSGVHQFFPYTWYVAIERKINQYGKSKLRLSAPNSAGLKNSNEYWSKITIPGNIKYREKLELNNFALTWDRVEDTNIRKVAAARFNESELKYINQDDPRLLNAIGINQDQIKGNGGVKAIFFLDGREYAYVAFSKGKCATAAIFDILSTQRILELPCLPESEAYDLNGAGGGTVLMSPTEILLSIGTPTMLPGKIANLAQDPTSLWGKTVRISKIGEGIQISIHSLGHRNPQGMLKYKDTIFQVEHGPRGGDEINTILSGKNYGWPRQSLGSNYNLAPLQKNFESDDGFLSETPLYAFVPSVGISDIKKCPSIYENYFAPLNCISVSSMRGSSIYFVVFKGKKVLFLERLQFQSRIRKFDFANNKLIAITDHDGLIVGELTPLPLMP